MKRYYYAADYAVRAALALWPLGIILLARHYGLL